MILNKVVCHPDGPELTQFLPIEPEDLCHAEYWLGSHRRDLGHKYLLLVS